MTLGRFAIAVGADPKWVLNAGAIRGRAITYSVGEARQLGLTRWIHHELGVPLKRADQISGEALALQPTPSVSLAFADGGLTIVIDLERYLSDFIVRLSRARTHYAPRRRGRPRGQPGRRVVERAREYGIDVDLVRANLRLSAAERLRRLDQDRDFVEKLRASRARPR